MIFSVPSKDFTHPPMLTVNKKRYQLLFED
jgi:hypothetical protein